MDLDRLFYPQSVAVVGASPKIGGGKLPYFQMIQNLGYRGRLYPVNPGYQEINGLKAYPSIDALPEAVDLVIVSVAARMVVETIEAAVRRGVKFMHFFTSGFSETGNGGLEKEMLEAARRGNVRIVGPNCIGVHCTDGRITFDPYIRQEGPGQIAFLGQSGGITSNFVGMADSRYIALNKVVSYGNQIDLKVEDYLEYLAADDSVKAIAAYIEDIKDGTKFFNTVRAVTRKKPLAILKGGTTPEGARAAASHTGAMAGAHHVWAAAMRQCRCIEVDHFEKLMDIMMMATSIKMPRGNRIGFLGAGGGTSVLFADLASRHGLILPELSQKAQDLIGQHISDVNTSTVNPVDLGFHGFSFDVLSHAIRAMDTDENIDVIIPYISLDFVCKFQRDQIESGPGRIIEILPEIRKPVIPVMNRCMENSLDLEETRIRMMTIFRKAGLSVFNTIQDAVNSISCLLQWSNRRDLER